MGIKLDRKALTTLLDDSTRQLPPVVESRLSSARQAALQRQAQRNPLQVRLHQLAPALSAPMRHHPLAWGVGLLFAALLTAAFFQWQHPAVHDHSALDLAILTDDLPVRMYVD
ncbi:MAG: DUF3619 family protein [Sideroxyarcus sp.]|nr:DUF3619 family protein [Sideroxyarcus sp.]